MYCHALNKPHVQAKGTAHNPSFVGMCLEDRLNNSPSALSEDVIKSLAAVVYAAGSDTVRAEHHIILSFANLDSAEPCINN